MKSRLWPAWVPTAGLLLLVGCYTYTPLIAPTPDPDQALAFDVNDRGRAEMMENVGPETARVEGTLLEQTDSAYQVSVARVITLRGRVYQWNGETVVLRREHVREVRERRFSAPRTVAAAGGATIPLLALLVSQTLNIFGTDEKTDNPLPPGEEPITQRRR